MLVILGPHRRVHVWPGVKDVLLHHSAHLIFLAEFVQLFDKVPTCLDRRKDHAGKHRHRNAESVEFARHVLSLPEVEPECGQYKDRTVVLGVDLQFMHT